MKQQQEQYTSLSHHEKSDCFILYQSDLNTYLHSTQYSQGSSAASSLAERMPGMFSATVLACFGVQLGVLSGQLSTGQGVISVYGLGGCVWVCAGAGSTSRGVCC